MNPWDAHQENEPGCSSLGGKKEVVEQREEREKETKDCQNNGPSPRVLGCGAEEGSEWKGGA